MAVKPAAKNVAKQNDMKKADAFLNQAVLGADGNHYRMPKGTPLFLDDRVTGSLIRKEKANRAAYDALSDAEKAAAGDYQPLVFTFTGTVYIPSDTPSEDIPL